VSKRNGSARYTRYKVRRAKRPLFSVRSKYTKVSRKKRRIIETLQWVVNSNTNESVYEENLHNLLICGSASWRLS